MSDNGQQAMSTTLQSLMWPEQGVCTEEQLYLRKTGPMARSESQHCLFFSAGGEADFSTWFNLFNLGKWRRQCDLQSLFLCLEGDGVFELSLTLARHNQSWEQVFCDRISLASDQPLQLDLSHLLRPPHGKGQLYFELRSLGEGCLREAHWQTQDAPRRQPQLALAVTTFRREAEVARTIERFSEFRARSWLKDHVEMLITDNGQTLNDLVLNDLALPAGVSVVPNENLGGAGGFTRGLLEARARGASHCLFMDDDASIHMQSLERTWMLLAYAQDPSTAVAGAMISEQHRWAIWENGALFHGRCHPLHMGTDLRDPVAVIQMENEANRPTPDTFYGGWWYFAFPLDHVDHLAFPFFVRGDDVSFSLANDFNILTLNGVVSFQESFTEKESPQTWYLDLRSHLAHHLSLPMLDVGARSTFKIALWFFLRNLPRMHYDTLAAINLAIEDVMQGPQFFDQNADMAARRGDLKSLTRDEAWQDLTADMALPPVRRDPPSWGMRLLMKLALNGLLIPGFSRLGRHITVEAQHRGHIGHVWGAAEIAFVNMNQDKVYRVRHSKRAAWTQTKRFIRNGYLFLKGYDDLAKAYRDGYDGLTSLAYWQDKLKLSDADTARNAAE